MRVFLCCLLMMVSSILSFAQNWDLINRSFQYNYIDRKDEVSTIFIDSVNKSGEDSIFYLNRIVKDCDTCTEYYGESPKYAFYNQPQFLNEHVIKTDTSFIFNFPNQFVIKHHAKVGESWVFDSSKNITAEIKRILYKTVFDTVDSIKVISLSSGNYIEISKNYGIIKFPSVYEANNYELIGINNREGDSIPDFYDIYNFDVGDMFEYHGNRFSTDSYRKNFIEKVTVKSKSRSGNTLKYDILLKHFEFFGPYLEYSNERNEVLEFVYNSENHANRFNNELINVESYLDDGHVSFCDDNYSYALLKCYKNKNGQIIKSVGSLLNYDFFSVKDSSKCLLERFNGMCDEHEVKYAPALGEIYHRVWGFEWTSFKELVGYVKGTDTVGIVYPDSIIISNGEQVKGLKTQIYPNPVVDISVIELPGINKKYQIKIYNIQGQEVYNRISENSIEIHRKDFNTGIYFYKITNSENRIYTGKFVVK